MCKYLIIVLFFLLSGCDTDEKPDQAQPPAQEAARQELPAPQTAVAPSAAPEREPTYGEQARADAIIAYANRGHEEFASGRSSMADVFHANARRYLQTFTLPARPKTGPKVELAPEKGLFDEKEAALLTDALADMDKALNRILGHYAQLEKYVRDKSIRDDGRLGEELADRIAGSHADFIAARQTWLDVVQTRAAEAERALLYSHPLKRQIIAGNGILEQLREVSSLLASGDPPPALLQACRENIASFVKEGAKPPFPARPALERLYRGFLKTASACGRSLDAGISEGFHGAQTHDLNEASHACVDAWNEFVKAANSGGIEERPGRR